MKLTIAFIFGTILGAVSIIGLNIWDAVMKPSPWVEIKVTNNSSHVISEIIARNDISTFKTNGMKPGKSLTFTLPEKNDGWYSIEYTLSNGTKCNRKKGYVMKGDSSTEIVTDTCTQKFRP